MTSPSYAFVRELVRVIDTGRSRSVVLSGNVRDLFCADADKGKYVPLVNLIIDRFTFANPVVLGGEEVSLDVLHLDLNDGIRFLNGCKGRVVKSYVQQQKKIYNDDNPKTVGKTEPPDFADILERHLLEARNDNARGLQILRRLTEATQEVNGPKLLILVEGADMVLPAGGDIASLSPHLVRKLAIIEDWFGDPEFIDGKSTVVLLSESLKAIHPRIAGMPQLVNIEVEPPGNEDRFHFIDHFYTRLKKEPPNDPKALAENTASLSIHAIRQLLVEYTDGEIPHKAIVSQISAYVSAQLGDAAKFYKPNHYLKDLDGFRKLKKYFVEELIPRLRSKGKSALPALIVGGPIRGGKTYVFEALAAEMDCPVLLLGNIRSQWFGGTDVILDKLEQILANIPKALVIVDEADTAFGGVGKDTHETERRLTGKLQAIMSNPQMLGRITWLLMTARIDQLSPDLRGEGRGGDLIIPVLDPDDEDRKDFVKSLIRAAAIEADAETFMPLTVGWYAGRFSSVRRAVEATKDRKNVLTVEDLKFIIEDTISPDIAETRRFQELQALINCTSRSLLPEQYQVGEMNEHKKAWKQEIDSLKRKMGE